MLVPEWFKSFKESGYTSEQIAPLVRVWSILAYSYELSADEAADLNTRTLELKNIIFPERNNQGLEDQTLQNSDINRRFEEIRLLEIESSSGSQYSWMLRGETYIVFVHTIREDGKVVICRVDGKKIKKVNSVVVSPSELTRFDRQIV